MAISQVATSPVRLGCSAAPQESDEEVEDECAAITADKGDETVRGNRDAKATDACNHPPNENMGMNRLDTFDGLRGLGALLVVAYHLRFGVQSAWICMGLFFGLSGLLMTSKVLQIQGRKGEFSILHFWRTRILRLIPALLAVVLCILAKSCIEWSIRGQPGGGELYYLRKDLLSALAYGENWNLINKQEDYFADRKKASVVRHVWSLSIEEQYYILWPIIFAMIVRVAACLVSAGAQEGDVESGNTSVMDAMLKPGIRKLVKVLCVFEIAAIVFSQLICVHTYKTYGQSAAYFSTYTRAGEFAVGGLSACLLHLSPWSLALFTRHPDRPHITQGQRIGLEIASAVTVLSILGASVIPLPTVDLVRHHLEWFRLPFTMLVLLGGSLQSLQTSDEPLSSWAVFTKFTRSRLLVYFGTTSYGLYLVHWILIIWFGDSEVNTIHSTATFQGREEGAAAWGRDLLIVAASVAISGLSFWHFERPVMTRAAHLKPSKVIGVAFVSMAAVAVLVLVVTRGAVPPGADETLLEQLRNVPDQHAQLRNVPDQHAPTKLLFLGDSQAFKIGQIMKKVTLEAADNSFCADLYGKQPWGPTVINAAHGAQGAIQYFGSKACAWCEWHVTKFRKGESHAKYDVKTANASYVLVIDSHFFRPWRDYKKRKVGLWGMEPHLKMALGNFIRFSAWHGGRHIFLATGSPFIRAFSGKGKPQEFKWRGDNLFFPDKSKVNWAMRQRGIFWDVLKTMRCKGEDNDRQRLLVSILDYHKLICPDFDADKAQRKGERYECNHRAPGFKKKLEDDMIHPNRTGGGPYLARQLQRVLYLGIARQGTFFSSSFRAPLKCYERLYGKEEEDGLGDLLTTFKVCVKRHRKGK